LNNVPLFKVGGFIMRIAQVIVFFLLIFLLIHPGFGQSGGSWGIRGGIGTDISGGIAFGGGINYLFPAGNNWMEIGPVLFISKSTETTEEFHTYEEETNLTVYGVLANLLFNYSPLSSGGFFLVGAGAAAISVEWEERSDGDTSLGTPLPSGGSKQSEEGTAGGLVLNFGAGYKFEGRVDVRAEFPIIIITDAPGEASSIAPTLTATLGIRF
jgi:hypothetical protein